MALKIVRLLLRSLSPISASLIENLPLRSSISIRLPFAKTLCQMIRGLGEAVAWQVNVTSSVAIAVWSSGTFTIVGVVGRGLKTVGVMLTEVLVISVTAEALAGEGRMTWLLLSAVRVITGSSRAVDRDTILADTNPADSDESGEIVCSIVDSVADTTD